MTNKLIVFEGIDGVGKTSISKRLVAKLRENGIAALRYEDADEPGKNFDQIKLFAQGSCSINVSFLVYLASALYKSERIIELLNSTWVVCDRYIFSTMAHHLSHKLPPTLAQLLDYVPIRQPDNFFLITVDEEKRIARLKLRPECTELDLVPNTPGFLPHTKETIFRRYKPTIVDNSNDEIEATVNGIYLRVMAED